jgi:hypothetical protein
MKYKFCFQTRKYISCSLKYKIKATWTYAALLLNCTLEIS